MKIRQCDECNTVLMPDECKDSGTTCEKCSLGLTSSHRREFELREALESLLSFNINQAIPPLELIEKYYALIGVDEICEEAREAFGYE